ncbi:MAG TPA: transcription elongation factor GreA, partial [Acidimicrobiales bacterium]|nr:transcription elongation factor GreA [Acidimicrobiales bacterium]
MSGSTLSRETYDRLRAELDDLTNRGRIEIAQKIEAARALGDLSENGDYHAAKDSQGHMELRIRQIEGLLRDAAVVDEVEDTGAVAVGSILTIDFDGDEEHYLVGNPEERREGYTTISPESPLGSAL